MKDTDVERPGELMRGEGEEFNGKRRRETLPVPTGGKVTAVLSGGVKTGKWRPVPLPVYEHITPPEWINVSDLDPQVGGGNPVKVVEAYLPWDKMDMGEATPETVTEVVPFGRLEEQSICSGTSGVFIGKVVGEKGKLIQESYESAAREADRQVFDTVGRCVLDQWDQAYENMQDAEKGVCYILQSMPVHEDAEATASLIVRGDDERMQEVAMVAAETWTEMFDCVANPRIEVVAVSAPECVPEGTCLILPCHRYTGKALTLDEMRAFCRDTDEGWIFQHECYIGVTLYHAFGRVSIKTFSPRARGSS